MLLKRANLTISRDNFVEPEIALNTTGATEQFKKLVAEIKRVAPRSDEFTYFRCIAIHAMEAANLDEHGVIINKGHITESDGKRNCKICGAALAIDPRTGEPIEGMWCSASGIEPYINQNGDAFPERELVSSYKSFVGRGLFVNHASDDAEKIRGIILDAAWIPKHKCVELLVAIDKVAFPELARQVEAGYSNDVSMGTQVAHSRCSKCGNKAVTEADYCFVPETKVQLENGLTKEIENIQVNDIVLTAKGNYKKVLKVFARDVDEEILKIKTTGNQESLRLTKNHPVLTTRRSDVNCSYDSRQRCRSGILAECARHPEHEAKEYRTDYVLAESLKEKDYTLFPINKTVLDSFTEDEVKLLGYFCAEGSFFKETQTVSSKGVRKGVSFALNLNEKETIAVRISALLERLTGKTPKLYENIDKNVLDLRLSDRDLAEFCYKHVGEYAEKKILSKELMLSSPALQLQFFGAYFDGDGYQCKNKKGEATVVTASKILANQLTIILARCGIITNLFETKNTLGPSCHEEGVADGNLIYRIPIYQKDLNKLSEVAERVSCRVLDVCTKEKKVGQSFILNQQIFRPITEIVSERYLGKVYNLEVEDDNSYVANNVAVHNCNHIKGHKGMVLEGSKTYEVNNGLNFIEISIVSTGADPKAKIRQVLASLNTLMQNRVVENTSTNENMTKLQSGINLIKEELKNIKGTLGGEATKEIEAELDVLQNNVVSIDNLEAKREGGAIDQVSKEIAALKNSIKEIESKLNTGGIQMTKEELTARAQSRRAYFQGGGGANEPQTYPVDPLGGPNGKAEKDRLAHEKSGETATVKDGVGKELPAEKEKLQRAELAERAQKRRAYFQGTTEPVALGKAQYPVEPMGGPNGTAETARLKEEKSGEIATLKDGIGKELTDGTKEKLMRAKLRAKFTTASEKKNCAWTVYAGDEPVITASVAQLYGKEIDAANKDDKTITNWDWVSSRAYGLEVIKACREIGISKTAEMMGLNKKAEGPADLDLNLEGPAGAAPAEPAAEAVPAIEAPVETAPTGVPEALEKIEDAVNEIRALEGEEESAESMELGEGLEEAGEELKGLEAVPAATASSNKFRTVIAEAIGDALLRVKKAELFIEARKSETTKKLEKLTEKCEKLQEKKKAAEGKAEKADLDEKISACQEKIKVLKKQIADKEKAKAEKKDKKKPAVKKAGAENEGTTFNTEEEADEFLKKDKILDTDESKKASIEARAQARRVAAGFVKAETKVDHVTQDAKEATHAVNDLGVAVKEVKKDLTSALRARSKARWAAAESLYGVTPTFDAVKDAHPKGGTTTEDGTGKAIPATNNGAHVETVTEQQKIDEQVAGETPRGELTARQKARREIVAGIEQTTAAVDTDAKKYWAQFYGEGDAASKTFGKDMANEKKASVATANTKLKMKRAYQVALKQQEVGQVAPGRPALEAQVDNLMEMDDAGFASFAKAVDNTFPVKKAEADKVMVRSAGAVAVGIDDNQDDLTTQLSKLNWRI